MQAKLHEEIDRVLGMNLHVASTVVADKYPQKQTVVGHLRSLQSLIPAHVFSLWVVFAKRFVYFPFSMCALSVRLGFQNGKSCSRR